MKAQKLRDRVTIYKQINGTRSPMGGSSGATWTPTLVLWASFEPLSVKDVINAQAAGSQTIARCKLRYRTDIDSKTRVGHRGKMYEVDGDPLPDNETGLDYITLMLRSVK